MIDWLLTPFATAVRFKDSAGSSAPRTVLVAEVDGDHLIVIEQGIMRVERHRWTPAELLARAWPDLQRDYFECARCLAVAVHLWLPCAPTLIATIDLLLERGAHMKKRDAKTPLAALKEAVAETPAPTEPPLTVPKAFQPGFPKVRADASRRTCLELKRDNFGVHCICMSEGAAFDVETQNPDRFDRRYDVVLADYPVTRAARLYASFAAHSGATEAAMRWLGCVIPLSEKERTMATKKAAETAAVDPKPKRGAAAPEVAAPPKRGKKTVAEVAPPTKKGGKKTAAEVATSTDDSPGPGAPRGPRPGSAAALFQELLLAGKFTDAQIFEKVKAKFGLDDKKRGYVGWYRNYLRKKGTEVPDPL